MKRLLFVLTLFAVASVASPVRAQTCASGGACKLGDIGPGGGTVIVVATNARWWGTYVEARTYTQQRGMPWSIHSANSIYAPVNGDLKRQRIDAMEIGRGGLNTQAIVAQNGVGKYAAWYADSATLGGKSDWVLPSRDELDAAYHMVDGGYFPGIARGAYWSSSENDHAFAWYQIFQDGTQFTDENGVGRINGISISSNKSRIRMAVHKGSGFPQFIYRMMVVRYFGATAGLQPPVSQPALTGRTCVAGGECFVGDTGPAGGVVFYDAGAQKSWGRYLESAPLATDFSGLRWKRLAVKDALSPLYVNTKRITARNQRNLAKLVGAGAKNTERIVKKYGVANYAARYASILEVNGFSDWFLPSEDELFEMYKVLHANDSSLVGTRNTFYWSSTEYDLNNAWTVNFKDGQQFDREKYLVPKPGVKALRVRAIRAFG